MAVRRPVPMSPAFVAWLQKCRWACGSKCFTDSVNHSDNPSFEAILARRLQRRTVLKGAAAVALILSAARIDDASAGGRGALTFQPVRLNLDDRVTVPNGYDSLVVIRWGDPL